jgi:uncharacterized protein YecT (DUF1311 family)
MNMTSLLNLAGTVILTLWIATPAHAECADAEPQCRLLARDASLDQLMGGAYCADCPAAGCPQLELAAAEELMSAQLRETASILHQPGYGDSLKALHAAQEAWERYRDHQCALPITYKTEDAMEVPALRERCRFELTVERILDLAEMQERLETSSPHLTRLH